MRRRSTFVKGITTDSNDAAIAAAIVSMGKILRMKVIAECVETEQQLKVLRMCGCDEVQGYLVSRPVGAAALAEKFKALLKLETLVSASTPMVGRRVGVTASMGH